MPLLTATVLVPTTSDRGPLLPLSVGSVLTQTVQDLEVFVVGDGVDDATRRVVEEMSRQDERIRFFDNPKHSRRGEEYRHAALAEARGRIVCYLTDRDLMLSQHIEIMAELLKDADFAYTLRCVIKKDGSIRIPDLPDLTHPEDRERASRANQLLPLSFAGHTLEMYRRLPHGWRTTPEGIFTDTYMWQQFLAEDSCRVATGTTPTILYFPRGSHPGWPVSRRLEELERWKDRTCTAASAEAHAEHVRDVAIRSRCDLVRRLRAVSDERDALKTARGWLRAATYSLTRKIQCR